MGRRPSTTTRFLLILALVLLCLCIRVSAAAAVDEDDSPGGPACIAEEAEPLDKSICEIRGNSDFYGLGVRLGIYFTWLTSWIANNFLPEEMSGAFDANSIFLVSLVMVVLYFSATYRLNALDALILLQLAFGFVFSVMSLWGYRTMYYRRESQNGLKRFGGWGTHFRLLLCGFISMYAVWYWSEGLADGLPGCAQATRAPCGGLKTFMFAKVDLYGPNRYFHLTAAVVCCGYYGIQVLAAFVAAINEVTNLIRGRKNHWVLHEVDIIQDGLKKNEITPLSFTISAFNLIWMIFSATSVEFILNFNHVTGVLTGKSLVSAGQLLPMFIGAFSTVRVLYLLFKEYYWNPRHQPQRSREVGLGVEMGMSGKTATAESPTSPLIARKDTAGRQRSERGLAHRVLTAWLPWLNTFEVWRGDSHRFELLREGKGRPYAPVTPDVEMRKRSVAETQDSSSGYHRPVVEEEEDTEYHGRSTGEDGS